MSQCLRKDVLEIEKVCQSCGLPLNERVLGNENNGAFSQEYCYLCYRNGRFIQPNMTLEEMKQQVIKMIDQSSSNKFQKWILKKVYPLQLKVLKRWR